MNIKLDLGNAGYGMGLVLENVKFEVEGPSLVLIAGRNGAGKTTLLRLLFGLLENHEGTIEIGGYDPYATTPDALARNGIIFMPQEGGVFDELTVDENIRLTKDPKEARRVLDILPGWNERMKQKAGTLSGGERKILGLARAIAQDPKILVVDEPTEGVWHELLPVITNQLSELSRKCLVVVVEQNLANFLQKTNYVMVMENGTIAMRGLPQDLIKDPTLESLLTL